MAERNSWLAALAARRLFEAEPADVHTREAFTQVMDKFRAIYHGNPASLHAPGAVEQVAELLAEQGRELNDRKSLRAAAGQYEFLAGAYPESSLAAPALVHALQLLEAGGAEDRAEAGRVRAELKQRYPHAAASQASASAMSGTPKAAARDAASDGAAASRVPVSAPVQAPGESSPLELVQASPMDDRLPEGAAPAIVTGIRHWSTASYTRVAIDLGGEVQYKAARTEHPDRIFFDLHGAKLARGLVDKTFAVTDGGFLSTIRAAQAGPDVTRVVLDVQPVAEYSAFLLPNPYRLIIDIHGKPPSGSSTGENAPNRSRVTPDTRSVAESEPAARGKAQPEPAASRTADARVTSADSMIPADTKAQPVAPVERTGPAGSVRSAASSTLPPMPVTDGSAGFGLPPKRTADEPGQTAGTPGRTAVARPRVVVTAKPTTAKPVPNTVTSATPNSSREVAALGNAPGVVAATADPTGESVVDRKADRKGDRKADRTDPNPVRRKGSTTGTTDDITASNAAPIAPPPPTSDGQSTLMRALGLKIGRIVIDAGHGGHDSGTLGADGIEEKDVVLDVSLRLGKLLHDRLGAEIVYTRADDTFIPLETRTAIANKAQADLFISVHANSSGDPGARGVEVYYLNFTSDPEAMGVASRENAVSSQGVNQLSDLVKKIALKDKIDESRELAFDVDQSLYNGLKRGNGGLKDRGVKKAPFVVLIGANMPSILAEISFVTNPEDATELRRPEYRERVAESLYNGIARYAGAINGRKDGAAPKSKAMERAQR